MLLCLCWLLSNPNHLVTAMTLHKCPMCGNHYTSRQSLSRHRLAQHGKPKVCRWCPKEESRGDRMGRHVARAHPWVRLEVGASVWRADPADPIEVQKQPHFPTPRYSPFHEDDVLGYSPGCQEFVCYVPTARDLLEETPQAVVPSIKPPQQRLNTTVAPPRQVEVPSPPESRNVVVQPRQVAVDSSLETGNMVTPPRQVEVPSPPESRNVVVQPRHVAVDSSLETGNMVTPPRQVEVPSPPESRNVVVQPRHVAVDSSLETGNMVTPPRQVEVPSPPESRNVVVQPRQVAVDSSLETGNMVTPPRQVEVPSPPESRNVVVQPRHVAVDSSLETGNMVTPPRQVEVPSPPESRNVVVQPRQVAVDSSLETGNVITPPRQVEAPSPPDSGNEVVPPRQVTVNSPPETGNGVTPPRQVEITGTLEMENAASPLPHKVVVSRETLEYSAQPPRPQLPVSSNGAEVQAGRRIVIISKKRPSSDSAALDLSQKRKKDLPEEPQQAWESLMRSITTIRYEPRHPDGFIIHQNNPALFFLGAPSQFYPNFQARQLSHIRELARRTGQYLGVRHVPAGLSSVRREEMAILPDGTIYKMGATWTENVKDLPVTSRSKYCQVVDGRPQED